MSAGQTNDVDQNLQRLRGAQIFHRSRNSDTRYVDAPGLVRSEGARRSVAPVKDLHTGKKFAAYTWQQKVPLSVLECFSLLVHLGVMGRGTEVTCCALEECGEGGGRGMGRGGTQWSGMQSDVVKPCAGPCAGAGPVRRGGRALAGQVQHREAVLFHTLPARASLS